MTFFSKLFLYFCESLNFVLIFIILSSIHHQQLTIEKTLTTIEKTLKLVRGWARLWKLKPNLNLKNFPTEIFNFKSFYQSRSQSVRSQIILILTCNSFNVLIEFVGDMVTSTSTSVGSWSIFYHCAMSHHIGFIMILLCNEIKFLHEDRTIN